jgi:signal transduction histidine kinase
MYIHNAENNKPEIFHLKESISTILTIYQNQLKSGIDVLLEIPETIYLSGYAEEVGQIWTNLIVNACQAMDFKGELKIGAEEKEESIIVSFSDTGCGIPSGVKDKIFEPFYSTKKIGEGSGLGLSIVKKIIDKHQGSISFVSEINKGTTFYVELPKLMKEETN